MNVLFSLEQVNISLFQFLEMSAELFIHLLEIVGLFFIVVSAIKALNGFFRNNPRYRLELSEGLEVGLTFFLAGEILRTVIVRNMQEIALVGGIIVLRVAITLLIHWEIKNEQAHIDNLIKNQEKECRDKKKEHKKNKIDSMVIGN